MGVMDEQGLEGCLGKEVERTGTVGERAGAIWGTKRNFPKLEGKPG